MRDLLITIIIFGSIPFIFQRPYIGILMWTWISLMSPHRLGWGMANSLPVAMVIGAVTLAAWLMSREEKKVPWDSIVVLMVVYVAWTAVTTAMALVPAAAMGPFEKFAKSIVMIILTLIMMRSEKRFQALRGNEVADRLRRAASAAPAVAAASAYPRPDGRRQRAGFPAPRSAARRAAMLHADDPVRGVCRPTAGAPRRRLPAGRPLFGQRPADAARRCEAGRALPRRGGGRPQPRLPSARRAERQV